MSQYIPALIVNKIEQVNESIFIKKLKELDRNIV
jgi:hypothetical protein